MTDELKRICEALREPATEAAKKIEGAPPWRTDHQKSFSTGTTVSFVVSGNGFPAAHCYGSKNDQSAVAEHIAACDPRVILRLLDLIEVGKTYDASEDWTAKYGRANSSDLYLSIVREVADHILHSGNALLNGGVETVARGIVSCIAHSYKLRPWSKP